MTLFALLLQTDVDLCNPNPCENGALCKNTPRGDDYFCYCPKGLHGKNCSETRAVCLGPQCSTHGESSVVASGALQGLYRLRTRNPPACLSPTDVPPPPVQQCSDEASISRPPGSI